MSKAAGARAAEAIGINASLSVLGKCITALTEGRRHVPYLESKLTTLLRPALGGNSRTTVVVTGSMVGLYKLDSVDPMAFDRASGFNKSNASFKIGFIKYAL